MQATNMYRYVGEMEAPFRSYVIVGLFSLTFMYSLFYKKKLIHISRIFIVFMVYCWLVTTFYGPIYKNTTSFHAALILSITTILPLFMYIYMYKTVGKISRSFIFVVVSIGVGYLLVYYLLSYKEMMIYSALNDEVRSSSSYIFLFLLPFLFDTYKKWLKILFIVIVLTIIVSSLKRGGIVASVLGLMSYFIVDLIIKNKKSGLKVIGAIIGVSIVFFVVILIIEYNTGSNIFDRFLDIKDDGGSGRIDVYKTTYVMISQSDFFQYIFGHGYNMVLANSPMNLSAHNDFLEIWYDYGLIALLLYICLYIKAFSTLRQMIRRRSKNAPLFALSFIVFTINSLIAHVIIYPWFITTFAAVWGYLMGKEKELIDKTIYENRTSCVPLSN